SSNPAPANAVDPAPHGIVGRLFTVDFRHLLALVRTTFEEARPGMRSGPCSVLRRVSVVLFRAAAVHAVACPRSGSDQGERAPAPPAWVRYGDARPRHFVLIAHHDSSATSADESGHRGFQRVGRRSARAEFPDAYVQAPPRLCGPSNAR